MKSTLSLLALIITGTISGPAVQADQMAAQPMAKHDQMIHEGMAAFTMAEFEAAQAAGKSILVDVYASWCPVCRSQESTLMSLVKDKDYANVVMLRVDYDKQKDVLKVLKVRSQSTLLTFKGTTETGRISFKSDPDVIKAFAAKAKG